MLTRRTILLAATSCIAACIATSRLANAGPGAADDASALAFVSAIYNSYTSGNNITVIPLIGDEPCIAVQSMSGWPLKKPVHKAMIANVGAAARPSHRAMPGAALPPPAQVSTS